MSLKSYKEKMKRASDVQIIQLKSNLTVNIGQLIAEIRNRTGLVSWNMI